MTFNDEIKHFGIMGMKWGRRRGRKSQPPKSRERISDDELKRVINRLSMEKQYRELTKKPPSAVKKVVGEIIMTIGKEYITNELKKRLIKP